MYQEKHKVFISYHHSNDQFYKNKLISLNENNKYFIDRSVCTGDISDFLSDEQIRLKIRDEYLRDSTVTILLVGSQTKYRKHIDWELFSSMIDGKINKKSGILVITLPCVNTSRCVVTHDMEKEIIHPDINDWTSIGSRTECEAMYPYLPDRIIDNLILDDSYISVVPWNKIIYNPDKLLFLINSTFNDKSKANYDLRRPMRRANS